MSNYSTTRNREAIADKSSPLCFGNLQTNISKYIPTLEVQWVYGLINVEEAASFEFAVLDDL